MAYSLNYPSRATNRGLAQATSARYQFLVTGLDNSLYKNAEKAISPMKAAGKAIANILRTHLGITNSRGFVRGVASNTLRRELQVVYYDHTVNSRGVSGVDRRIYGFDIEVEFRLENPKSSRGYDYGLAIGAEGGYTFRPTAEALARWIRKKKDRSFYWTDSSGNKHYPTSLKTAKRAAFAMLARLKDTPSIVLPNWYEITDADDQSQISRNVVRASNLFMKDVSVELRKQYKK